jgi:multiple sugar transport system ATP-binding protein
VRRPAAFLFDEPLSNLDAALRAQVRGELKQLHSRLRATFVYVTHDQTEAMTLPDRVALLREGRLEQLGSPRELYDAPRTPFVASYFGSPPMNLVPPAALGLAGAGPVGLRPEHVEVGLGPPPEGARAGRVWLVEPLGAQTWVTLEVEGAKVTGLGSRELLGRPGDAAWFRYAASQLLRFA